MATTIEPSTLAQQLAQAYLSPLQKKLTSDQQAASANSAALNKLKSALQAFNDAMAALSNKQGVTANAVSINVAGLGTATARPTAVPSNYQFFVEKVATAHQIAFKDLPTVPVATGGPLVVQLADGSSFTVNLAAADGDMDGTLTQTEIARAINLSAGNGGKVTASVVRSGAQTNLVLTAGQTGAASKITLDASGLPPGTLRDELSAPPTELSAAEDAVLWLGAQGTGVRIQQASNTFEVAEGVSLTVAKAMATGDAPAVLSVSNDPAGTAANVQSFIDAFNTLKKTLDELTSIDRNTGTAAVFASDPGVRNLRNQLNSLVRQEFGGVRLMDFGVGTTRSGMLTLDRKKLEAAVAARAADLNALMGSQSLSARSGLLGELDVAVDKWTNVTDGHIKVRLDSIQEMKDAFTKRQDRLDRSYQQMYQRYLAQFTQLQALQERMAGVGDMFQSILAPKK